VQVTPSGSTSSPPTVVSNVVWMPFGPVASYTLGNGEAVTRTYDANYRLTDLTSNPSIFNLHFARDVMGDISGRGPAPGANPATETYQYDPLYRLTSVTDAGTVLESYTYNRVGDRLSKTATGPDVDVGTYYYTSGTHQLASIGNATRAYDANGNTTGSVVGGQTYGFAYNARQRPVLAQANGLTVGTYIYNALGQRVDSAAATTERFDYDEAGHLIGTYGVGPKRIYVWLDDLPIALVDNTVNGSVTTSTVNYVIADQLGTPRAVTNGAGTVLWGWGYQGNPFGEQQPTSSTGYVLNLRYPGQYYDAETGTVYNGFRNYEPGLGRYLQSDPIGLNGGISTYAYVGNDPLSGIDPLGLDTFQIGFSFTYSFKIPWTSIGAAGTAGVGAAFDTTGQIATYGYYGGAAAYGTFGANGGVQFAGSNADTVQDLGGKFNDYSLTAADGPGGSLGYFSGKNADGCKNVKGGSLTIGGGTPGGYLSVGQTNTYIGPVGHLW